MISSISSLSNQRIKDLYHDTRDHKNKLFVIESLNMIKDLSIIENNLDIVLLTQSFLDSNQWIKNQKEIIVVNEQIIKKISFTSNPPQCIAIKKIIIENFDIEPEQNYLILDHIQDPGNLATIIRTSVALSINKIFISNNSVSIYNDKFLRSTMGTIFDIKVNTYDSLLELVTKLEKNNIECIATCLDKESMVLDEYKPESKFHAIILGNESKGIDTNILKSIKHKVFIKINHTNSLNVASAASIILYQKYLWDKNG